MAKLICPLSGISYSCKYGKLSLSAPHPYIAFTAKIPLAKLIDEAERISSGNTIPEETKLIYLSLLFRTNCILFKHTAYPAPALIHNTLDSLIKFLILKESRLSPEQNKIFPSYVISAENANLAGLPEFLISCHDILINAQPKLPLLRERQLAKINSLTSRKLSLTSAKPKLHAKILATWFANVFFSEQHSDLISFYQKLILDSELSPEFLQMRYKRIDIIELDEFIAEYSTQYTEYTSLNPSILSSLKELCKNLLAKYDSFYGKFGLDYKISDSNTEHLTPRLNTDNLLNQSQSIPTEAPIRSDYKSDAEFNKAKILFNLSQK